MWDSPLCDVALAGGLSLLFLVALGLACDKTLENFRMWDAFMRLLVEGPEKAESGLEMMRNLCCLGSSACDVFP